jgi:hypothetical protein
MYCNNSGGACFFFDIDVKGGERMVKKLNVLQGVCVVITRMVKLDVLQGVAINAKGGDYWHVLRQRQSMCVFH